MSILCDIQGPKIRTGKVKEPFNVDVGDRLDVTPDSVLGTLPSLSSLPFLRDPSHVRAN